MTLVYRISTWLLWGVCATIGSTISSSFDKASFLVGVGVFVGAGAQYSYEHWWCKKPKA